MDEEKNEAEEPVRISRMPGGTGTDESVVSNQKSGGSAKVPNVPSVPAVPSAPKK